MITISSIFWNNISSSNITMQNIQHTLIVFKKLLHIRVWCRSKQHCMCTLIWWIDVTKNGNLGRHNIKNGLCTYIFPSLCLSQLIAFIMKEQSPPWQTYNRIWIHTKKTKLQPTLDLYGIQIWSTHTQPTYQFRWQTWWFVIYIIVTLHVIYSSTFPTLNFATKEILFIMKHISPLKTYFSYSIWTIAPVP